MFNGDSPGLPREGKNTGSGCMITGCWGDYFWPKRYDVTGGWRKLHNEELHSLYYSRTVGGTCTARGRTETLTSFWLGILKGRNLSEDVGVDGDLWTIRFSKSSLLHVVNPQSQIWQNHLDGLADERYGWTDVPRFSDFSVILWMSCTELTRRWVPMACGLHPSRVIAA
jgi:hypothetical protein